MITRVIYQFINSHEARWATNAMKHEVKVDWKSRAPLCSYARVAPGSEGRSEGWEARPGGGEDARRAGLGISWGRRTSLSRPLTMSREMFGVVVGAFGDAIDGNGDGGVAGTLWDLAPSKRGVQESE